jgi:2,3-bisphosphoglycerate-independent phosphoglycerate mutase
MHFLFFFLDGIGLGLDNPEINPFARAGMPNLQSLLEGRRLLETSAPFEGQRASLLPLDACLGVEGLPQSATGQAALLTGKNVSAAIGKHYGPKPNPPVAEFVQNGNLFSMLKSRGYRTAFLNAYPQRYFDAIKSGLRMYSAIPLAVHSAGLPLRTKEDLFAGQALAADLTGQGWKDHLGMMDTPVLEPHAAGRKLARLAQEVDFAFFEYWLSDYAGHGQEMGAATGLLETLDSVLGGLLEAWDDRHGLALITSDHGNLEDLSTRRHTRNPVPGLVIGDRKLRQEFTPGLKGLIDVAPSILRSFPSLKRPE